MNEVTFNHIWEVNSRKVADDKDFYWVDKDELIKMTEQLIRVREGEAILRALKKGTK